MTPYVPIGAAALAVLALGCARLVQAATLEASGRLDDARTRARSAKRVALAALLLVALVVPMSPRHFPRTLAFPLLAASSAVAVLLAALSGKPRPSGWIAAVLLAAAVVTLFVVR